VPNCPDLSALRTSVELSYGHFGTREDTSAPGNAGPNHSKVDGCSCGIWPYPGIAPGGYSIHYTNTSPNPYPGDNARNLRELSLYTTEL